MIGRLLCLLGFHEHHEWTTTVRYDNGVVRRWYDSPCERGCGYVDHFLP